MNTKDTSICRLCRRKRQLCDSHIFPEFFYKPMYDKKHRFLYVSANPEDKIDWEQKGLRDYLLCKKCEKKLNKYEDYAAPLLNGGNIGVGKQPQILENSRYHVLSENIDYTCFKLLQLSLLWRAGVTTRREFSAVRLGPHHEEKLRRMILDGNPGEPYEYGCVVFAILNQRDELVDIVSSPRKLKIDGHICYRFLLGGFLWLYVVSSHSAQFPYGKFFLRDDGKFVFIKAEAKDSGFLIEEAHAASKRKADVATFLNKRGEVHGLDALL